MAVPIQIVKGLQNVQTIVDVGANVGPVGAAAIVSGGRWGLRCMPFPARSTSSIRRTGGPYHFARQFKAATGLPPHQYVIARRVERAKELLHGGGNLSLAEVAAHAGFSDQSVFCHHFKRLVGVTPGRFRTPASIA